MSSCLRRALFTLLCLILCAGLIPAAYAREDAAQANVVFYCGDESALPGLTVTDSAGNRYAPVTDADTGAAQYGRYLLPPGDYQYAFHDETGRYEDAAGSFTAESGLTQLLPLPLSPRIEVEVVSFSYINPLYADVLSVDDLPEAAFSEEELIAEARGLSERTGNTRRRSNAVFYRDSGTVHTDIQSAGAELKAQIQDREALATIYLSVSGETTVAQWRALAAEVFTVAIAHTGAPTEGDYIRYEFGGYNGSGALAYNAETDTSVCTFKYDLLYYTTAEQEAELDAAVAMLLDELDLDGKSDYEKIRAVYDSLTANVKYDNVHGSDYTLKFTAYAALVDHLAVCQGYATAFYRLCLAAGVDTRIITSSNMGHAWNIAALGGTYYALDATWDAGYAPAAYRFLLRGSEYWLAKHKNSATGNISELGDKYNDASFAAAYPLPGSDAPAPLTVSFESSGGSAVAARLLMSGDTLMSPEAPTKEGYWFVGWYSDSDFSARYDFGTVLTADLTLYARWAAPDFLLPAALTEIGEEAFAGGAFTFAVLPETALSVGPRAFADCPAHLCVYLPASVKSIDPSAFDGVTDLTIFGVFPSAAETFAEDHGLPFSAVSE